MTARPGTALPPETTFSGVSIDSRTLRSGDLFVAIRGEKHDGHDYVDDALEAGAAAAIVSESWLASRRRRAVRGRPLIAVPDTLRALQDLAQYHRRRLGLPVIGVTGSNGKTTTKEMTAAALATRFRVLKSEGSFNNHIGVPLTLLRLRRAHEIAVVEMGMNHPGEIATLCRIAEPTGAIVTNVGAAHLEFMGSLEAVAEEKQQLVEAIDQQGFAVLNADDDRVAAMAAAARVPIVTFGLERDADLSARLVDMVDGIKPVFEIAGGPTVSLQVPGRHNVANALAALAAAVAAGCDLEEAARGLEEYRGAKWRGEIVPAGRVVVLNDAYNANPVSARNALDMLCSWNADGITRRVAVLGDMLEMGENSASLHRSLGHEAAERGIDLLLAVGRFASETAGGARSGGMNNGCVLTTEDVESAWQELSARLCAGDAVLLKGSRGIGLEMIAERISERVRTAPECEGGE